MLHIAIIEDNEQYRKAVSMIIQMSDSLNIIHTYDRGDGLVGAFKEHKPDVVLMDIDLPEKNGIQATWELKKEFPDMKVIMLTVFEDEDKIFGALKAGANGYLLKKDTPQKIIESVSAVYNGESPMNGMIAAKVLEYFQQSKSNEIDESGLTEREKQILQLLIKGNSYKEISASIFISTETLNSHIKNIYRKLNVHSRAELSARYGR